MLILKMPLPLPPLSLSLCIHHPLNFTPHAFHDLPLPSSCSSSPSAHAFPHRPLRLMPFLTTPIFSLLPSCFPLPSCLFCPRPHSFSAPPSFYNPHLHPHPQTFPADIVVCEFYQPLERTKIPITRNCR